jgi:putative MATE family efflux protein
MRNVIVGALINIVLDPLFIFGFNLGVKGAAIATVIAQAISALLVASFFFTKKTILKLSLENMKLDIKIILSVMALGLAPFIMQSTESIISICFNTSLYKYGGDVAVGAMTILTSLMQFAMLPLQGFASGAQPIISYNYGAKNPDRIKKVFKVLLIVCVSFSTLFWLLSMMIPKVLVSIFTIDQELILFASKALRIYMAVICMFGIQIACQQTFVSLGNAPVSLFLALLRKVILLIPLIYIVPLFMENKCDAVFLAEPIADFIAVSTTGIMFLIIFKKTMKKIEMKEA